MQTIWKIKLQALDIQHVGVPKGAKILCVHEQAEGINLWVQCDPSNLLETRTIVILGTGDLMPSTNLVYLGTAFLRQGAYVFHVFEQMG